jgi:hypothetical protein
MENASKLKERMMKTCVYKKQKREDDDIFVAFLWIA